MKFLILLSLFLSASSFAANITANCRLPKAKTANDAELWEVKAFQLKVVGEKVALTAGPKNAMTGTFYKRNQQGAWMYSSTDVLDTADQTDYGYIIVSPELYQNKNGKVTLSVRQLGDSEGAWWLNQSYACTVKSAI